MLEYIYLHKEEEVLGSLTVVHVPKERIFTASENQIPPKCATTKLARSLRHVILAVFGLIDSIFFAGQTLKMNLFLGKN